MSKILIVEDNPFNVKLLTIILGRMNVELFTAMNAFEAWEIIEKEIPDLIILDIGLPDMNGIELTKKIRKVPEYQHIKILAITAFSMFGDKEKILRAGCDYYISKPIDTRSLPKLIEDMLQGNVPPV